jgi:hypothetical protein
MNRVIVRYALIVIAIGAFLVFILRVRAPFGTGNSSFAVSPDADITRIDLIQKDKKVSIEKSEDKWLINKKEETRKSAVLFMLRTLKEIKIKSPVSAELFDNEIIRKQIEPVKVNVFAGRRPVKSFLVYKTGSNLYGNIMKMRAFSKPFIAYIPGYEDNIGIHFVADELFWKPFIVFHLLPSEITAVKYEDIANASFSFIINYKNRVFSLSDLKNSISGWDTLKVKRYLTYFTAILFDSWAFNLSEDEKKSIESALPLYRITVTQSDGKIIILTVWEKWKNENGINKPDTDRVWAKTNQRDEIFIMKYLDLDPILKKRAYFFSKNVDI